MVSDSDSQRSSRQWTFNLEAKYGAPEQSCGAFTSSSNETSWLAEVKVHQTSDPT